MEKKELIKIDRNQTKHWRISNTCWKCRGVGNLGMYFYNWDGGKCFECNGAGVITTIEKEYTPEYQAKLDARREKREQKKNEERFANIREQFPDGIVYIVLGNTYEIKDQIKNDGGKFNNDFLWHFNRKIDGYNLMEIKIEDAFTENGMRRIDIKAQVIDANNKIHEEEQARKNTNCEFIGNVGDKLKKVRVVVERRVDYPVSFHGYRRLMSIYIMRDDKNNVIVWKTSTAMEYYDENDNYVFVNEGDAVLINATIKEHSEYNGTKQTVVTRVKCSQAA